MRKRTVAVLFAVALGVVVTGGLSFTTAAGISGMWKGIVTDELCAKNGLAQADDAECPRKCVANGSKYALYSPADNKVYVLNPQEKMAELAGKRVNVKGTLDGNVITVANITVTPKK